MDLNFECDTYTKATEFLATSPDIDIFIVDIVLGDKSGFPLIRQARQGKIHCLVVSMHSREPYISEAMSAGANGYISKDSAATELIAGIRAVCNGKQYYSQDISRYLTTSTVHNPFNTLTNREIQVCLLIIEGIKVKKIAREMNISPKTVYVHKANAYKHLGINSTQELFQLIKKHGLYRDTSN